MANIPFDPEKVIYKDKGSKVDYATYYPTEKGEIFMGWIRKYLIEKERIIKDK